MPILLRAQFNGLITNKFMHVLDFGNVRGVDMIRFSERPEVLEKAKLIKRDNVFMFIFIGILVFHSSSVRFSSPHFMALSSKRKHGDKRVF